MCASWKRGIESFLCFLIGYGVVPMGFLLARHCQAVPVSRSRPLLLRYSGRGRLLLSKELLRLVRWGLCFFCSSLECATVSSRLAFGLALYVLRMNVAIKNTTFFLRCQRTMPCRCSILQTRTKKGQTERRLKRFVFIGLLSSCPPGVSHKVWR